MRSLDKRNCTLALVLGLMLPALSGCISDVASGVTGAVLEKIFEDGPTRMEATIEASKDLNPDYDGEASPLVVTMYQLKSPVAFNNATFFALYDGDLAELGDDLAAKEELELRPGDTMELEREFKPETRFIGVMASYRDIDNAKWRAIAELETGSTNDFKIDFKRLEVKIEPD